MAADICTWLREAANATEVAGNEFINIFRFAIVRSRGFKFKSFIGRGLDDFSLAIIPNKGFIHSNIVMLSVGGQVRKWTLAYN
jgi:hypothetical protein